MFKLILNLTLVLAIWGLIQCETLSEDCLKSYRESALKTHNDLRAKHGSPDLVLDDKINSFAQNYSNILATVHKKLIHNHNAKLNKYGENLAYIMNSRFKNITLDLCSKLGKVFSEKWYNEIKRYNFESPEKSKKTGHFTQLVWKNTKNVGFGLAYVKTSFYGVADYQGQGNIKLKGDPYYFYKLNVLPKLKN